MSHQTTREPRVETENERSIFRDEESAEAEAEKEKKEFKISSISDLMVFDRR